MRPKQRPAIQTARVPAACTTTRGGGEGGEAAEAGKDAKPRAEVVAAICFHATHRVAERHRAHTPGWGPLPTGAGARSARGGGVRPGPPGRAEPCHGCPASSSGRGASSTVAGLTVGTRSLVAPRPRPLHHRSGSSPLPTWAPRGACVPPVTVSVARRTGPQRPRPSRRAAGGCSRWAARPPLGRRRRGSRPGRRRHASARRTWYARLRAVAGAHRVRVGPRWGTDAWVWRPAQRADAPSFMP